MKKLLLLLLKPTFGSKRFLRFYTILKNISLLGLNYRGTDISTDGELFFIRTVRKYYGNRNTHLVLFDVGANIGNYSVVLDREFCDSKRTIYAFEPFSKAYNELEKLSAKIADFRPIRLGLSDKTDDVTFLSSTEFNEVGGLYKKDFSKYNFSLDLKEAVHFETLQDYCNANGIARINFLKIDVEGHDYYVLKGAQEYLDKRLVDFIQFEFGAANFLSKTYLHDFFQILTPQFRLYRLLKNGFEEIKEYNTDIEIHVQSNFVAISRDIDLDV
ncbi:MAG: FkbM family methyltransferase [Sphingobacteriales bacterium]|nr:FkbM family methyltransferase [Sphingobacteriales bacterium]